MIKDIVIVRKLAKEDICNSKHDLNPLIVKGLSHLIERGYLIYRLSCTDY